MNIFKQLIIFSVLLLIAACVTEQENLVDTKAEKDKDRKHDIAHKDIKQLHESPIFIQADEEVVVARRMAPQSAMNHGKLHASTSYYRVAQEPVNRDNYRHLEQNGIKQVKDSPVSTFSVDVDTASYSNMRRMLSSEGRMPPRDAIRVEELINYFNYQYEAPKDLSRPFAVNIEMAPAPWNNKRHLLKVGLKGYEDFSEKRPAANLVFLIDVSGSMQSRNKLTLAKSALKLLVNKLNHNDRIALVVYAGAAGMVLDSTRADEKAKIMAAIDGLTAGGSTNGEAGINLAYSLAQQHFIKDGINRVLIASDGDMNVGTVGVDALKDLIKEKRRNGISLTTLGFGSGNYNDALMEQLADVGNGNSAYIDSLKEAQKVLVEEMNSTLLTIAKDVKIQVEFNPQLVSEYRLIGYENRLLNREDFRNDKVDAGDIGAGHTVTALYEVTLVGEGGEMIPPLRYQQESVPEKKNLSNELAFVRLRYKKPTENTSIEFSQAITFEQVQPELTVASENFKFAAAVAGFGQLLKGGKFTGDWDYNDALSLAKNSKGKDEHGYRGELISLLELANSVSMQP